MCLESGPEIKVPLHERGKLCYSRPIDLNAPVTRLKVFCWCHGGVGGRDVVSVALLFIFGAERRESPPRRPPTSIFARNERRKRRRRQGRDLVTVARYEGEARKANMVGREGEGATMARCFRPPGRIDTRPTRGGPFSGGTGKEQSYSHRGASRMTASKCNALRVIILVSPLAHSLIHSLTSSSSRVWDTAGASVGTGGSGQSPLTARRTKKS